MSRLPHAPLGAPPLRWLRTATLLGTVAALPGLPARVVHAQRPAARTPAAAPAAASGRGVAPNAGRWAGVVTNGYTGDSVHFTVAPDGRSVRDVRFAGYWRCADGSMSGSLEESKAGPPDPMAVRDGAFASTQTRPSWWWQVEGRFTAAGTAEGTYRQSANSATCDTRLLRWTARRVGR